MVTSKRQELKLLSGVLSSKILQRTTKGLDGYNFKEILSRKPWWLGLEILGGEFSFEKAVVLDASTLQADTDIHLVIHWLTAGLPRFPLETPKEPKPAPPCHTRKKTRVRVRANFVPS